MLGVSRDADLSAIKSADRKLALKFHSDGVLKDPAETVGIVDEFLSLSVQQAYEMLRDNMRRSMIDASGMK